MPLTVRVQDIRYNWKRIFIPLAISAVTIGGLLFAGRGDIDYSVFYRVSAFWIFLAVLKMIFVLPVQAWRWQLAISAQGHRASFKEIFLGVIVRTFFNNITPGVGTGGEIAGAYYLAKRTSLTFKAAMASSAAERIVQGLAVVVISIGLVAFALPVLSLDSLVVKGIIVGLLWFAVFMLSMLYLSLFKIAWGKKLMEWVVRAVVRLSPAARKTWNIGKIREEVGLFHDEYRASLRHPWMTTGMVALTVLQAGLEVAQPYFIFLALGVPVPLWTVILSILVIKVIGVFAIFPGGSGLVEAANYGIYEAFTDIGRDLVIAHTVLFRVLDAWLTWLVSGIVTAAISGSVFRDT